MGHHHREETINPQSNVIPLGTGDHPFFSTNDLTCLSIIIPFLGEPAKQLISFFMEFGNSQSVNSTIDPVSILKQLTPKLENSPLKEILPNLLSLLSNQDTNTAFNPAILASLLGNITPKQAEP
ncbi:MAG TPA: hypothetical protein DDW65_15375 [Firmicutes bacterium]|jgi:hypothetical protein|nr:hypothetical protein [Bacillota bacterium]